MNFKIQMSRHFLSNCQDFFTIMLNIGKDLSFTDDENKNDMILQ